MGPFDFNTQWKRADRLKQFIHRLPKDIDPNYRAMWEQKLQNIAWDPKTYYDRYKLVYTINGLYNATIIKESK